MKKIASNYLTMTLSNYLIQNMQSHCYSVSFCPVLKYIPHLSVAIYQSLGMLINSRLFVDTLYSFFMRYNCTLYPCNPAVSSYITHTYKRNGNHRKHALVSQIGIHSEGYCFMSYRKNTSDHNLYLS